MKYFLVKWRTALTLIFSAQLIGKVDQSMSFVITSGKGNKWRPNDGATFHGGLHIV